MKKYDIIASRATSAFGGNVILSIEYGIEDYVLKAVELDGKMSKPTRSRIRYNAKGEAYFMHYGRREYLSEYIRHDI